ncbi:hypothetical protein HHK36_010256 [Tetracentron sinense]|uniref:RRM domain-containing protein n=1 Tax=Tetracentron sinense TaxID=13715 RepID=A0A834ZN30_TETSI|nr:hypothetical protein HHK36_010256 [Tetracentron sinense]
MVKFLKPNKAVIVLQGRFAGRKAVIVRSFDEGTRDRPYGHCLVAGIGKYPKKVIRKDSAKKTAKKSRVKAFIKLVNYNHIMPTRYTLDVDLKDVITPDALQSRDKKVTAAKETKARFEERFKTGKNRWFFSKLSVNPTRNIPAPSSPTTTSTYLVQSSSPEPPSHHQSSVRSVPITLSGEIQHQFQPLAHLVSQIWCINHQQPIGSLASSSSRINGAATIIADLPSTIAGEYRCFVDGLALATNDESLETAFSSFGEIIEIQIFRKKKKGNETGRYGYVIFSNEQSMRNAIAAMNGQVLDGQNITVNEAQSNSGGGNEAQSRGRLDVVADGGRGGGYGGSGVVVEVADGGRGGGYGGSGVVAMGVVDVVVGIRTAAGETRVGALSERQCTPQCVSKVDSSPSSQALEGFAVDWQALALRNQEVGLDPKVRPETVADGGSIKERGKSSESDHLETGQGASTLVQGTSQVLLPQMSPEAI